MNTALVIGLGASGRSAAALLLATGVDVRGYDNRTDLDAPELDGARLFLGAPEPPPEAFVGIDLMVLSPGVPPGRHLELCRAHAPTAEVSGELALALRTLPPAPTVLITGTNGKSTVTALLGELLRAHGATPFVGGNLGEPPTKLAAALLAGAEATPSHYVLECSSYQLETLPPTPTAVAMLLNVSPDHLSRYDSMEHYAQTKANVFAGVADDGLALLDAEDGWTPTLREAAGDRVELIGDPLFASIEGDGQGTALRLGSDTSYPRAALGLPGRHNAKNALFALAAARHLGASAESCLRGLQAFRGLPHRMERVRELDGVTYYNDSKATNVASVLASLGGLSQPFVLIAGGQAKGDDLAPLRDLLAARGRGLVTIGEAGDSFAAMAEGVLPTVRAGTMDTAVPAARKLAQPGDLVVLAPACASWDQFRSFAHRGEVFSAAVQAL